MAIEVPEKQLYQLEVSDRCSTWGAAGKRFRPGIHIIDDLRIVEAAENSPFCRVRLAPRNARVGQTVEEYNTTIPRPSPRTNEQGVETMALTSKQLTGDTSLSQDLIKAGLSKVHQCTYCDARPFARKDTLERHIKKVHGIE